MQIVEPATGMLACGDVGKGKLAPIDLIIDTIIQNTQDHYPLVNKNVLVSAGPTQESLDPVRFITNHSSGKMGYAIAKMARRMGANVTLISGPSHEPIPYGINYISVTSANDMFEAIKQNLNDANYIIKAAAVGDYSAKDIKEHKIKKAKITLP